MAHSWQLIKNSRLGGHRPLNEYRDELSRVLSDFEEAEGDGFRLHESVREFLGLSSSEQVIDTESLYESPYPFLHDHGRYLCGLLATPTSAADGLSEFTSLYVIATPTQLLTVIMDPPTTYAGPFGQRLINRRNDHESKGGDDIGSTLLMIVRDNVTSLNFALREISHDVEHYADGLFRFGSTEGSGDFETLRVVEAYLIKLQTEIESLTTVADETARLVSRIVNRDVDVEGSVPVFDRRHEIAAETLAMQARQIVSIRARLEERISSLLTKCEQLRDKFFVEATHRIGAVAALLLVPTFIVGLYGQNFEFPERNWISGYGFSWILIVVSTVVLVVFFRRRKWL